MKMVIDIITVVLLIMGALLMLFASIGLLRLPDIYMRLHATTKSSSMGILMLFAAVSLFFIEEGGWLKVLLAIFFIFLTVPIASHIIGRVAHLMKIPKWDKTICDDLEEDESKTKQDGF